MARDIERARKWQREYYHKNKKARQIYQLINPALTTEKNWIRNKLYLYGLTQAQFNKMLSDQNGLCGICDVALTKANVNIDHIHGTKVVRGLLCTDCNLLLGKIEAKPTRLERIKEWLQRHQLQNKE